MDLLSPRLHRVHTTMIAFIICAPAWAQTIRYVDADAPGANDGTSWVDAFRDLQDALDAAEDGDEIRVAGGVYKPDRGTGDRLASFRPEGILSIYGGHAGFGVPNPDERDFDRYQTVLSGDLDDNDGPDFANRSDNSNHVMVVGDDTAIVLDGLTITAGQADDPRARQGAGLHVSFGIVEISHCVFSFNQTAGDRAVGGGLYNAQGTVRITHSMFEQNRSTNDGAGIANLAGIVSVEDSTIRNNSAARFGGGIHSLLGSITIRACSVTNNLANFGAGICANASDLVIDRSRFADCQAGLRAGAIKVRHGTLLLTNSILALNSAPEAGALSCTGTSFEIDRCLFVKNQSEGVPGIAGLGGAIHFIDLAQGVVSNSVFSGNYSSHRGGAVATNIRTPVAFRNCTFARNVAGISGSVLQNVSYQPTTIANSIIWDNGPTPLVTEVSTILVTFSAVENGYEGEGNIDENPLLGLDDAPWPQSPVIDAGDPGLRFEPGDRDLGGHPRVLCGRVDMGAYEFGIGDFGCDREVDLEDYGAWPNCMTGPEGGQYEEKCEAFDFDADGDVDVEDFSGFMASFGL